jgi:uncharacterized lipoprotein YehR (DUF1307 family)
MKLTRMLAGLSLSLALAACGNQALEGEYKNQGNGIYSAVEFKGKSTAVVKGMGMTFPTSYEKDGQAIRLKTDKSDLLFTVKDSKTLVGEGFAEGVYKKD